MAGDYGFSEAVEAVKHFFAAIAHWTQQAFHDVGHFFSHLPNTLCHSLSYVWHALVNGLHAVWIAILKGFVILGRAMLFFTFVMFCLVGTVLVLAWISMAVSALLVYTRRYLRRFQSNRILQAMDETSARTLVWRNTPLQDHERRPLNPHFQYHPEFPSDWLRTFQEIRRERTEPPAGVSWHVERTSYFGHAPDEEAEASRNPVRFVWSAFTQLERAFGEFQECVICIEGVDDNANGVLGRLDCGHIFHRGCIAKWFHSKQEPSCPSCRKIFPAVETASHVSYGTV